MLTLRTISRKGSEAAMALKKVKPKIGRETLLRKMQARQARVNRGEKNTRRWIAASAAVMAFDRKIGIPIALVGVAKMLQHTGSDYLLKKKLVKDLEAARFLAEQFKGTEHATFFEKIANQAEKLAKRKKHKAFVKARREKHMAFVESQRPKIEKIAAHMRDVKQTDAELRERDRRYRKRH